MDNKGGGGQDGRVEGLSSLPSIEHIKNTPTCGAVLTENKLGAIGDTLLQSRLLSKIHIESSWKGEVTRLGP